jgi:hypothetical protein
MYGLLTVLESAESAVSGEWWLMNRDVARVDFEWRQV